MSEKRSIKVMKEVANNIQWISETMHNSAQRIQNNAGISSQLAGLGKDLQKLTG